MPSQENSVDINNRLNRYKNKGKDSDVSFLSSEMKEIY